MAKKTTLNQAETERLRTIFEEETVRDFKRSMDFVKNSTRNNYFSIQRGKVCHPDLNSIRDDMQSLLMNCLVVSQSNDVEGVKVDTSIVLQTFHVNTFDFQIIEKLQRGCIRDKVDPSTYILFLKDTWVSDLSFLFPQPLIIIILILFSMSLSQSFLLVIPLI